MAAEAVWFVCNATSVLLQKKQAPEPYSNFVKSRNSFGGPEKVSYALGCTAFVINFTRGCIATRSCDQCLGQFHYYVMNCQELSLQVQ
jgi:hypothetical protein